MVKPRFFSAACVFLAATAAVFGQNSYVFQLPGPALSSRQLVGWGDDNFSRNVSSNNGPLGSYQAIPTPNGNTFYILAGSGIQVSNATLSTFAPISGVNAPVTVAAVSPDGRYLLAVADHFYMIDTSTNAIVGTDVGVPGGTTPVGFAVSSDSSTVWVLSNQNPGSYLTPVSLSTHLATSSPLPLPFPASAVTLSPKGLLYVSFQANEIDEIDPAQLAVTTPNGRIAVPAFPGPLRFTPDGTAAYFVNTQSCGSCAALLKLSLPSYSVASWPPAGSNPAPVFDDIYVGSGTQIFGFSSTFAGAKLWDIAPSPFAATPSALGAAPFPGLPINNVLSVAISTERPAARFLYLLTQDPSKPLVRIDLGSSGISGQTGINNGVGTNLWFAPIPPQTGVTHFFTITGSQSVGAGATSAPLIAQALDGLGRPVYNVPVCFSSDGPLTFTNPSQVTNAYGLVRTTVTTPGASGTYTVTLTAGQSCPPATGAVSTTFTINVGTQSGGGSSPQFSIFSGDGQLIRQTTTASQRLTVQATDASGNPVSGLEVDFSVDSGSLGHLDTLSTTTDANGFATSGFVSGTVPSSVAFIASSITASSTLGSVSFVETTQNALVDDTNQPRITITAPETFTLTIPQGGKVSAGVVARTVSLHTPPPFNVPIPNIAIRLADPVNSTLPSTVVGCAGPTRGDNNGVSTCDVVSFCQPAGTAFPLQTNALISVGEAAFHQMLVTITKGSASLLTAVSGDNQSGTPGTKVNLTARVTDGCSQTAGGVPVTWTVLQGAASPASVQTTSFGDGTVSAQFTLGGTPGSVQIQLTAANITPIVFHLNVQTSISGIGVVTGGGQTAVTGTAFANPVVFVVRDTNNNPVPNLLVNFSVTGSATINPTSATTNAQGQVQTNVTAGATAGTITVTATSTTFSNSATLTSHQPTITFTPNSFTNAASGSAGLTPCGLATVSGTGIAPNVQGVVLGVNNFGAFPTVLAGVSISVQQNTTIVQVPIIKVTNDSAGQRADFQAPCNLIPGTAIVAVTVNGAPTTVNGVSVFAVQPGTFTTTAPGNKLYGAVIRELDGTYVTSANPAHPGEKYYMVVTGLGQTTPALITNSAGTGNQTANIPMLIFLNGRGIATLSVRYLLGSIGSYLVEFQIPSDATTGTDQSLLAVGLVNNGNDFIVGNTVLLPAVTANDTGGGGTGTGGTGGTGTGGGGTGTGGGDTGTGGGGTGTGGGGTGGGGTGGGGTGTSGGGGTSGATTPTQDEINTWIARGNYVSGQLSLTRSTASTTTDSFTGGAPTTSSTKTDSFSGQFTKTSGTDLSKLLNNQLPSGFPVLLPSVGTCSVYSIASLTNPFPNLTTVNLDAGTQLTSNGPNGTQLALRQSGPIYSASNVPNTYLAAGQYTLSGPGGADIGVFSGNLNTVADLVVTNPGNFNLINRGGAITVNWTGGEQSNLVFISGSSATINLQTQSISGSAFICSQNVSAGQFTVPASILTQLPASTVTAGIVTRGSFSVTASGKGTRFTAPSGVDILTANNSWVWSFTPQYQ